MNHACIQALCAQERPKVEQKDAARGPAVIGNAVLVLQKKKKKTERDLEALMHLFLPQHKFAFELFLAFLVIWLLLLL